ncbi:hypothetical protein, partial [Chitinophaga agrisoli]|uniref:hypothetical protein n=1 Tax=Chitinophaga agrisoli TaxID=2607653 RepID=UPI001BC9E249
MLEKSRSVVATEVAECSADEGPRQPVPLSEDVLSLVNVQQGQIFRQPLRCALVIRVNVEDGQTPGQVCERESRTQVEIVALIK